MKRILLGFAVAIFSIGVAQAQDDEAKIVKGGTQDPFRAYYGNTYSCYWPDRFMCKHWWNEDGTEIFFEGRWLPEGMLTMKAIEGPHAQFVANGQWCSANARRASAMAAGDAKPIDTSELNNNKNGCQPIVDGQPGSHWFKLHLNGAYEDQREQYSLMPGHQ